MVPVLIVAHGELGLAMLRAAEGLLGPQERVAAVSNAGCGLSEIVERVRREVPDFADGPAVLFSDLLGGSCHHAARTLLRENPDWRLVSGVNLPMVVNFLQNRNRMPLDEALELAISRAREGVQQWKEDGRGLDAGPAR